jgi:D-alanyl-D-alanine carboxypeptidase
MAFVASRLAASGRRARRLGAMLAAMLALWLAAGGAYANSREAALVLDANTGRVLYESNADEPRFPASLTKMMTLYMMFGEIEAGRMTYATRIKISEHAAGQAPSKLDLDPGEEITAINAIKALITKSANDVAAAVAEHIGGTEPQFARMMTARARQIGMMRTTFRNASGLPDPDQVTTARDMITLGLRLYDDHQKHWSLFSTRFFSYEGNTYRNHNTMLGTYEGADGIKTGYIRASGFNIVTSVQRGSKHVMVAVFGGATAASRNQTARNLLDRALLRASPQRTRRAAPMLVAQARPAARPPVARPAAETRPAAVAAAPTVPSPVPPRPVAAERPRPPRPAAVADAGSQPGAQDRAALAMLMEQAVSEPVIEIARVRRVALATPPEPVASAGQSAAPPASDSRAGAFALPRFGATTEPAEAPAAPGRPPSTLDMQARVLATDEPPLPPPVQPAVGVPRGGQVVAASTIPAAPAASSASGGFQLQVGAYGTAGEAERMISATRARSGDLLKRYESAAIPVQKDNRRLFRARFTGFDAASAQSVCNALRQQKIDCFVMRAE